MFKSWFLDRIVVLNMTTNQQVLFSCNKWLAKNKDDNHIARDLYPINNTLKSDNSIKRILNGEISNLNLLILMQYNFI